MGGVPRREFVQTMEKVKGCDVLFVTDPEQCFYGRDVDRWVKELKEVKKEYDGVLFIGNCMGSTGALAMGSRVGVDRILVFSPICFPHEDPRFQVREYTKWCLNSQQLLSLEKAVVGSVGECRYGVEVHRNISKKDVFHTFTLEKVAMKLKETKVEEMKSEEMKLKEMKLKVVSYDIPGMEESVAKLLKAEDKLIGVIENNLRIAKYGYS